jgi:hypothetical protein
VGWYKTTYIMEYQRNYTLDVADKLIEKWTPILVGFSKKVNGQIYTVTHLSKEPVGNLYKVWVETDNFNRDELTDVVHANLELLAHHHSNLDI